MKSLCFPRYTTELSDAQINEKILELNRSCTTLLSDRQSVDLKNDKELELFSEILERSSVSRLQSQNLTVLINCAVKIVAKYSHFHVPNAELSDKKQSDKYHVAKENYVKLLNIYPHDKQEELPEIVITAINSQNIWSLRKLCVKLVLCLIDLGISGPLVYHQLCDQIRIPEASTNDDAKLIVKVLYESLENYKWPENDETAIFIERLLNIYHKSLRGTSRKTKAMAYTNLRACLELCVRYLIRNITNNHRKLAIELMSSWSIKKDVDDDFILNYGSTLEYAAYMHQGNTLTDTLTADILALLMLMIGSKIRFVSLLGNRVFQYLIDSGKNQTMFNTPKIFFQGMQINMTPCKYFREDRRFLKKHRAIIHDSLIRSFINHRTTRLNVETTYCTVCLLIIVIPCGFTAAAMCCLVMNLQEIALNRLTEIGLIEYNSSINRKSR